MTESCKVRRPVKIDRELVRAWRSLNRIGAVVVALRYSETDHLAVARVRRGDRETSAVGWTPGSALDVCRSRLA